MFYSKIQAAAGKLLFKRTLLFGHSKFPTATTLYIYIYTHTKKKQDIYHISWRTPWYIYIYIYIIIYLISWQTPRFMCIYIIYIIIMCCGEANNKPSPIEVYCWVYSHYDDGNWPPVIVRGSPALQEGHCLSGFSHVEDEFPLTVGSKNGFDVLTHTSTCGLDVGIYLNTLLRDVVCPVCLCKSVCDMSMYKI